MTGAELIARERMRQIDEKGYTAEYDDLFVDGQLAVAAACHAVAALDLQADVAVVMDLSTGYPDDAYPWEPGLDTREKHTPEENLEIAGALIAAELDRRKRLRSRGDTESAEKVA